MTVMYIWAIRENEELLCKLKGAKRSVVESCMWIYKKIKSGDNVFHYILKVNLSISQSHKQNGTFSIMHSISWIKCYFPKMQSLGRLNSTATGVKIVKCCQNSAAKPSPIPDMCRKQSLHQKQPLICKVWQKTWLQLCKSTDDSTKWVKNWVYGGRVCNVELYKSWQSFYSNPRKEEM